MKRCLTLKAVLVAALCFALCAVSGYAQFQTGNIYGKVQTKDGSVLPGVTVTLTGVGAPQQTVTDALGNFRFISLSVGTYSLRAELAGYGTATRSGISVRIAQNSDVTMTLNPSVAESITVTAEAPLLDVRKTGTGANVAKVELDNIPSARDPWVILQQAPGVQMDRMNVGGNMSGQQSTYVSKGVSGANSTWNVDGVNITDFAATGSSPTYYDFGAFEEMQITTGGTDPRIQTAGVQLNMVTKRGTNDFRGSGRLFHTSSSYQADPKIPGEAQSYLKSVNQIDKIDDYGAEIGGPIWKDKLWFWGGWGRQKIAVLSTTIVAGARFLDKTTLTGENLKVNAQPFASNSLVATDAYNAKVKLGRNVGPSRAPETAWNQNDAYAKGVGSLTDPTIWKIEDTQIIGRNLYLTGLYSKVQGGFQLIADNSKGCQSLACGIDVAPAFFDLADSSWHRSYISLHILRPTKQTRLDGSAFFNTANLSHELKFGYGYRKANVRTVSAWPGSQYTVNYGAPGSAGNGDTGAVQLVRSPGTGFSGTFNDIYIGDTILTGNLTVQAGLRYDLQKAANAPGGADANPTVPDQLPAITFAGVSGLKFDNISPRLGLTYALGSDRRTLLRASYSRYVDQVGGNTVPITNTSPGAYSYLYYYYNDLNHDNVAQRNEIDFNYGLVSFGGIDPTNPTVQTAFSRWASNLKAPHTDEIILGGERELLTDFSVGINGTYRKLKNFIWTVGEKHQGQGDIYSTADYVLHAPATCDPAKQNCAPFTSTISLPYYVLAPGVPVPTFRVVMNRPDYNQTYKGLELTANKRMSNRWMLRGNFTFQDWKQHVSGAGIIDPTKQRAGFGCEVCDGSDVIIGSGTGSGSFGGVYINSKWAYSLTGLYQLPIIETSLGFNLNGRQGYALPYVLRVTAPSGEGNKFLLAENDVTQFRNANVRELDLRLAKDFRISRVGLTVSIDGFNVLNSNTILQRNVGRLAVAASNRVTEVLSPRVFRLGARLNF
jgi:hypothetical protein